MKQGHIYVCLSIIYLFLHGCVAERNITPPIDKSILTGEHVIITYETSDPGGKYGRKNVFAVWIEDAEGNYIQTLDRWGKKRAHNLKEWVKASGHKKGGIDALTGATPKNYTRYSSIWDMKDRNGRTVPNGVYTVRMELTNDNAPKNKFHRASFAFEKNGKAAAMHPVDCGGFLNVILNYSGIQNMPKSCVGALPMFSQPELIVKSVYVVQEFFRGLV